MLSIKEIDKIRYRMFDGKATDRQINKVFSQSLSYVSLVEKIKELDRPRPEDTAGATGQERFLGGLIHRTRKALIDELQSFIGET